MFLQPFNHSWFLHFASISYDFPAWFLGWWIYFSTIDEIFPEPVPQDFNYFKTKLKNPQLPKMLMFVLLFRILWILCWGFCLQQRLPNSFPSNIVRTMKVKWWPTIDNFKANIYAV